MKETRLEQIIRSTEDSSHLSDTERAGRDVVVTVLRVFDAK